MSDDITFTTPDGETVTLARADAERWIVERVALSNYGAAAACREALDAEPLDEQRRRLVG